MNYILILIIVFLLIVIAFLIFINNGLKEKYDNLKNENYLLKEKYEKLLFEMKKLNDADAAKSKELSKEFLSDTAYWMKRTFFYAKECKKLRDEKNKNS